MLQFYSKVCNTQIPDARTCNAS